MYIDPPFTGSNGIKVIEMNEKISNLEGKVSILSGWGTTEKERGPDYLSETSSKITMDADDHNGMGVLRMPNTAGSGVCQGDSGGNTFVCCLKFIHPIDIYIWGNVIF